MENPFFELNKTRILEAIQHLDPRDKGNYAKVHCPDCSKPDAYVYYAAGKFAQIRCSHLKHCGHVSPVVLPALAVANIPNGRSKEVEEYFAQHELDLDGLIECGLLDKLGRLRLNSENYKHLSTIEGKLRWKTPRGWKAEMGAFYPVIETGQDILHLLEGESDWMKGFQDGFACTTSLFGAKYVPKTENDFAIFAPYEEIEIAYDNDPEGERGAGRIGLALTEKYPTKKITIKKLLFKEGESGKDYCDWRKFHNIEEYLVLPVVPVEAKKTAQEKKLEKAKEKFEKQRQEAIKNGCPFTEVISRLEGYSKAYIVAKEGIFEETVVQNQVLSTSLTTYQKICSDPVMISERLEDMAGDECYIKLSWSDKEKVICQDMLCSKNFDKLVKFGIRILGANTRAMSEYFLYALGEVANTKEFSTRNGWIKNEFIFGNKVISQDGTEREIARREGIQIGVSGDEEVWCGTIKRFTNDPQVQIACGASTISPFLEILRIEPSTVHFYQDSSVGKSFAAKLAASLWGHFDKIVKSWFGTVVGHEMYFHQMKNLPCFLDESQLAAREEIVAQTAYQFANGYGKTRAEINSGEVVLQSGKNWHTFLISTGEKKVTEVSTFGGLSARVIEIYRRPIEVISEAAFTKTYQILSCHYGWGGLKIIKYICENKESLRKQHEQILEDLENSIKVESNIQKRLLPRWAAIILGSQINQKLFGFQYDGKAIFEEIKKSLCEMENEKPSRNLYEAILELYHANKKRFHQKSKEGRIIESSETEVWGFFDDERKAIYFLPRILRRELTRQRFAWSMLAVLKEQGKLIHDEKSFQTMARILGEKLRFVSIILENESIKPLES